MKIKSLLSAVLAATSLSACNSSTEKPAGAAEPSESATTANEAAAPTGSASSAMVGEGDAGGAAKTTRCPIMSSSDWAANLSSPADPKAPRVLTVSGMVTVNTGGYKVALAPGATMESQPPIQQMILTVTRPGPGAIVQQVITHLPVKGTVPDAYPAYKAIEITCDGDRLATIKTIGTGK